MKSKKLCCALLIGALISSSYIFTYYSRQEATSQDMQVSNIEPLETQKNHLDTSTGGDSFSDYFWVSNDDGAMLNIYVKNNGKQQVNYQITHGKSAIRSHGSLQPGKSIMFTEDKKRAGKWTVTSNTSDGSKMDVYIGARQEVTSQTKKVGYITPLKAQRNHLDTSIGGSSFSDYFWVSNDDGTTLNIYVKNNGKQQVNYQIAHGKSSICSHGALQPGKSIMFTVDKKRAGKWTVTSNTSDGSTMDVYIKARQFE